MVFSLQCVCVCYAQAGMCACMLWSVFTSIDKNACLKRVAFNVNVQDALSTPPYTVESLTKDHLAREHLSFKTTFSETFPVVFPCT